MNKTQIAALVISVIFLPPVFAFAAGDEIPPPPPDNETTVVQLQAPTPVKFDPYKYKVPQKMSDGWKVGDLRKEKADLKLITQGVEKILSGAVPDVQTLTVLHNGKIVLDEYFKGGKADDLHSIFSVTKSVFSTVYGIAQDQGLLNTDQKIYDLYPEYRKKSGWDPKKEDITVGMILSMTSGVDCDDATGDFSCSKALGQSKDWVDYCFGLKLKNPPGKVWTYNGSSLVLLSNLIAKKSGMNFTEFAHKYLLEPLDIHGSPWWIGPNGVTEVDAMLEWKSRDMAKLGQLYLDKGMWEGKRIVSEAWVKDATSLHAPPGTSFGHSYGYLWHLKTMTWKGNPVQIFYANGYQGQNIYVSPDAGLVCVITATSDNSYIYGYEDKLFENEILGAFN